jgi:hypothetical protein
MDQREQVRGVRKLPHLDRRGVFGALRQWEPQSQGVMWGKLSRKLRQNRWGRLRIRRPPAHCFRRTGTADNRETAIPTANRLTPNRLWGPLGFWPRAND